jgi:antitoxin (DNA-binding transcriptional repressor) of toxin-antitoxin stability system
MLSLKLGYNRNKLSWRDKVLKVTVEEALRNLKSLWEQVALGEGIILCEQDKAFAKLVPLQSRERLPANMQDFRASLQVRGEGLSSTIIKARQGELQFGARVDSPI